MHHTIITIDIASYGHLTSDDVTWLLSKWDQDMADHPVEFEDWKVRVHQEHEGTITAVPGWTTPEGVRG